MEEEIPPMSVRVILIVNGKDTTRMSRLRSKRSSTGDVLTHLFRLRGNQH